MTDKPTIGLRESAKLAWRALEAASRLIETMDPDDDEEHEELSDVKQQIHDAAMGLYLHLAMTLDEIGDD